MHLLAQARNANLASKSDPAVSPSPFGRRHPRTTVDVSAVIRERVPIWEGLRALSTANRSKAGALIEETCTDCASRGQPCSHTALARSLGWAPEPSQPCKPRAIRPLVWNTCRQALEAAFRHGTRRMNRKTVLAQVRLWRRPTLAMAMPSAVANLRCLRGSGAGGGARLQIYRRTAIRIWPAAHRRAGLCRRPRSSLVASVAAHVWAHLPYTAQPLSST